MMGLADRGRVLDLFEMVMGGDAGAALAELGAQYQGGADPVQVLRDLAEVTHWISVLKVAPASAEDATITPDARARGQELAQRLSLRVLGRMWQMGLKVLAEVAAAPDTRMAAEMALIRMTHVADLPPPEELIRRLEGERAGGASARKAAPDQPGQVRWRRPCQGWPGWPRQPLLPPPPERRLRLTRHHRPSRRSRQARRLRG